MQVYENRDFSTRTLSFAWFTYGDGGQPFWLWRCLGSDRSRQSPYPWFISRVASSSAALPPEFAHELGATFTFPDCGHMTVNYNGDASAIHGPKGQGSVTFTRVADVNGLACL